MKTRTRFIFAAAISTLLLAQNASAQVPQLVNYQGRVAVGTVNFEGTGQFRFALVNAAGTTVYWSSAADTAPADGVPDTAVSLPVSKGLYSVLLGDTSVVGMAAIPTSVWANSDVRLRVWFNDGTNGNQLLTPDQRLAPNGYLPDGSVVAATIAAGAVGSSQLAANAVQNANIATGAIGNSKLGTNAVTTAKIAAGAVTDTQLASGIDAGKITIGALPDARLSGNIPRLNAATFFNGPQGSVGIHPGFGIANGTTLLGSYNSATADGAQLRFSRTGDNVDIGQNNTGAFVIETADVPRFAVAQNGNVGIGTTTPTMRLQVAGPQGSVGIHPNFGVANNTTLLGSYNSATTDGAQLRFSRTGDSVDIGQNDAGSFVIETGDALRFSVAQDGNVGIDGKLGIGTTDPAAKLHIFGTGLGSPANSGSTQSPGLVARLRDGGNILLDIGGSGGGGFWLQCTDGGNLASNYPLTLNPNGGNVGIGTTSPATALHVAGTITAPTLADAGAGLEFKVNGQRALRLEYANNFFEGVNVIGGWSGNSVSAGVVAATIAGGGEPSLGTNRVHADFGTVGGGRNNTASGDSATVGGGVGHTASGGKSTVTGGHVNTASGEYSTVAGGWFNTATGFSSFAAGQEAHATHNGSFVWSDVSAGGANSSANNEFTVRASGGVRFFSNSAATVGVSLAANGTAWATISDRNAKKNFRPVDGQAVLEKLAAVPVQQWNYKTEPDDAVPHLGPMAQEFKAAFYPGRDDKTITTLEFDGVELAAIQALNEKLKAKDAEIAALKQRLADNDARDKALEARLARIEAAAPVKVVLNK